MVLRRLIFPFLLVLFVIVGLEAGVRFLKIAPPLQKNSWWVQDAYVPYKAVANSEFRHVTDEFSVRYKINSMGFRDVEHSLFKPEGVLRIVAIGDSFTWGQGADRESTYPYQLEVMLNNRTGKHPRVEVINLGICNYFTEPERLSLEHYGKQFKPDIVLVGFERNDVIQAGQGIDAYKVSRDGYLMTREGSQLGNIGSWLYIHSHACRIVLRKYVLAVMESRHPERWDQLCVPEGSHEADWLKVEGELSRINDICKKINSRMVVVNIPEPNYQYCLYAPWRINKWCGANGVDFLDSAYAINIAEKSGSLFWEHDPHLKPQGYHILAQAIFDDLVGNNIAG